MKGSTWPSTWKATDSWLIRWGHLLPSFNAPVLTVGDFGGGQGSSWVLWQVLWKWSPPVWQCPSRARLHWTTQTSWTALLDPTSCSVKELFNWHKKPHHTKTGCVSLQIKRAIHPLLLGGRTKSRAKPGLLHLGKRPLLFFTVHTKKQWRYEIQLGGWQSAIPTVCLGWIYISWGILMLLEMQRLGYVFITQLNKAEKK